MKVSSFKQFLEEEDSKAIVQTGINSKGIDNNVTKEIINSRLALVTNHEFLTPYIALGSISRVLAYANIIVPQYTFLDRHEGEIVFDATQFGKMFGVNTDGTKVPSESGHFVYFSYVMNDDGYYDCFAALVDQDELDDILDIEGEDEEDVDKIGVEQKVNEDWKDTAVEFAKDVTPGLGTYRAAERFQKAKEQGDVLGMVGHGADTALSAASDAALAIPVAGAIAKGVATGIRGAGRLGAAGVKSAIGALGRREAGETAVSQAGKEVIAQADKTAVAQAAKTAEVAKSAEVASDAAKAAKTADIASDSAKLGRAGVARKVASNVVKRVVKKVLPGLDFELTTPRKTKDWVADPVRKDPNTQSEEDTKKKVDEEPLNELSPSLLKRYREARQARMDAPAAGKPSGSIPDENILRNRERSLKLAADKLSGNAKVPAEIGMSGYPASSYTVISKLKRGAKKIKQWDDKLGNLDVIPKTTNYADSPARDSGQASQAFLQQQRQSQAPSIQDRPSVQQAIRRGTGIGMSGYPASSLINSYDPSLKEESVDEGTTKYWNKQKKRSWLRKKGYVTSSVDSTSVKNTAALAVRNARDIMKKEEVESIDERKSSDPKGLAYKVTAASHAANPEWGPPDHTQDPQTHFGTAATRSSTLAAIKAIRGIKKFDVNNPEHVEAVSRAIHGSPSDYEGNARGWSQTAMTHPAQTHAQKERRAKLTGPYDDLSEPEKEKDRQIARTVATNIKKK